MNDTHRLFLGLSHIGLPTSDFDKTREFYKQFGFSIDWSRENSETDKVAFLRCGSCVIETYLTVSPAMANGAVDHIALDVSDIDKVYEYALSLGYAAIEKQITYLPFFEYGVKYFTIQGVNNEKVEFSQKLSSNNL